MVLHELAGYGTPQNCVGWVPMFTDGANTAANVGTGLCKIHTTDRSVCHPTVTTFATKGQGGMEETRQPLLPIVAAACGDVQFQHPTQRERLHNG
jgi:hypothetical protein